MAAEIEIKLRIGEPKRFLKTLAKVGAKAVAGRVHEMNLLFDTPDGGLAKHGQLLRIRTETPAAVKGTRKTKKKVKATGDGAGERYLLTFKSPPEQMAIGPATPVADRRHKVREELETLLVDAEMVKRIFEGLGLRGWFRYEKYRTPYKFGAREKWAKNLVIDYDETPIGTFVELEGPPEAIDEAARRLGYGTREFITKNYLVLYLEDCRRREVTPAHMLF